MIRFILIHLIITSSVLIVLLIVRSKTQSSSFFIQNQNQEKRIEAELKVKAKVGVQLRIASKEEELVKVLEEELVKEAESLFVSPTSRSSLRSKIKDGKIGSSLISTIWYWMVAIPTFTFHTILPLFLL